MVKSPGGGGGRGERGYRLVHGLLCCFDENRFKKEVYFRQSLIDGFLSSCETYFLEILFIIFIILSQRRVDSDVSSEGLFQIKSCCFSSGCYLRGVDLKSRCATQRDWIALYLRPREDETGHHLHRFRATLLFDWGKPLI